MMTSLHPFVIRTACGLFAAVLLLQPVTAKAEEDKRLLVDYTQYKTSVVQQIKKAWHPKAEWQGLEAGVCFEVEEDGSLDDLTLCQNSGNTEFDAAAQAAVKTAAPFAAPPEVLSKAQRDFAFILEGKPKPVVATSETRPVLTDDPRLQDQRSAGYIKNLNAVVRKNWALPVKSNKKRHVTVDLVIGPQGELLEYELSRSSGSKAFDDSVIKAVKVSAPFDPIPEGYGKDAMHAEVNLNYEPFRLQDLKYRKRHKRKWFWR
ncbi:MAG: TonB C-terminal domain-containing protein [Vampirovibrio sp.]|nr:TonB C-terminal domain-containing protein [Vampirovibrio sp.]